MVRLPQCIEDEVEDADGLHRPRDDSSVDIPSKQANLAERLCTLECRIEKLEQRDWNSENNKESSNDDSTTNKEGEEGEEDKEESHELQASLWDATVLVRNTPYEQISTC